MEKYALVSNGVVTEFFEVKPGDLPISERLPKALVDSLIKLDPQQMYSTKVGMAYNNGAFYNLPSPEIPDPKTLTTYIPVYIIRERMETAGTWADLVALLQQDPALMMKVLTLRDGVAADDEQARALIKLAGSDPDEILAP